MKSSWNFWVLFCQNHLPLYIQTSSLTSPHVVQFWTRTMSYRVRTSVACHTCRAAFWRLSGYSQRGWLPGKSWRTSTWWYTMLITLQSPDKEPAFKELPFIRNWFLFPNFYQGTSSLCYTFIWKSGYKKYIFMVSMSSLQADSTVYEFW